jgi:hypothetical protein
LASVSRAIRNRRHLIALFLLTASITAYAATAAANCDEDCKNEYVSALGDCRNQYEQDGKDLQDLEDCLVDTRGEYQDCVDDCTSMGAGGVVACRFAGGSMAPVVYIAPVRGRITAK